MLSDTIRSIPEERAFLEIIMQFDKLLKKYAKKLAYEDAYNDLLLFFVELITNIKSNEIGAKTDAIIVQYIATAVKNHYIKLSKQSEKSKVVLFSELSEEYLHFLELNTSYSDEDNVNEYFPLGNRLTDWEHEVLTLIYIKGYSISAIASTTKKSRQAVNQTKLRAIQKLRDVTIQ